MGVDDYEAVYRREFRAVARTVYLVVHDRAAAEEITQDAFVTLIQHWGKVSRYERPDAWVRRVAIRMATRYVRREHRRGVLERGRPAAPVADDPSGTLDVLRAVGALPARQRAAVVLFYYEDRPVAEVAELLGCTPAAAKVLLHRGRRGLADLLAEEVSDVAGPQGA